MYYNLAILRIRLRVWLLILVSIDRPCMQLLTGTFNHNVGFSFKITNEYLLKNQSITRTYILIQFIGSSWMEQQKI